MKERVAVGGAGAAHLGDVELVLKKRQHDRLIEHLAANVAVAPVGAAAFAAGGRIALVDHGMVACAGDGLLALNDLAADAAVAARGLAVGGAGHGHGFVDHKRVARGGDDGLRLRDHAAAFADAAVGLARLQAGRRGAREHLFVVPLLLTDDVQHRRVAVGRNGRKGQAQKNRTEENEQQPFFHSITTFQTETISSYFITYFCESKMAAEKTFYEFSQIKVKTAPSGPRARAATPGGRHNRGQTAPQAPRRRRNDSYGGYGTARGASRSP